MSGFLSNGAEDTSHCFGEQKICLTAHKIRLTVHKIHLTAHKIVSLGTSYLSLRTVLQPLKGQAGHTDTL